MSSSEEYLDNLLKAMTEGGNNGNEAPTPSVMQDMVGVDDIQGMSTPEESDNTMSMDDIEAMLTSMGEEVTDEEPQAGEAVLENEGVLQEEPALSDELVLDESVLSDEAVLDESVLSDELVLDESMLSDELVLDESMLSDEAVLDDNMLSDEAVLDESMLSDEAILDDSVLSDELALDDSILPDELESGDMTTADEPTPDDAMTDESILEDDAASDELSLEELGLGDLGLEELGLEETVQDESEAGDDFMPEDESVAGDDFALEDGTEIGDDFMPEDGSEVGVDLGLEDEPEAEDNFAIEENGEEDAELSALLASMGGDEDLSEINELLEKSDQGIAIDDDMMAMLGDISEGEGGGEGSDDFFSGEEMADGDLGNIREITPEELEQRENPKAKKQKKKEEKERKKRDKQAKKAKNKKASSDENAGEEGEEYMGDLLDGVGESEDEPKKQGIFARFLAFLLEEDEEEGSADGELSDDGVIIGNLSEENKELLAELKAEDQKNAKKKDKKDKKAKKGKKDKKGKGEDGADGEDEKAEAKPKKPKKEKKKKEKKIDEEPKIPEKKLSKKKVVSVFLFCASIAACIIVVTMLLPDQMEKQEARLAFDHNQYEQVYELFYGKELSEEDEVLFKKSSVILQMQRKLDSYENYTKMDMPLEALNALIEGVRRYDNLMDDVVEYNVGSEVAVIYGQILDALANDYGLSEADAMDIISSEDNVTYSQRIQSVISGEAYGPKEDVLPAGKQDVLPEEEEIIDRLEGMETE